MYVAVVMLYFCFDTKLYQNKSANLLLCWEYFHLSYAKDQDEETEKV